MDLFLEVLQNHKETYIQTHASLLIIKKPYIYKIKKNVNFGFLDFSTKEKRLYYSILEVRLNQRLCNEIYKGIEIVFVKELLFQSFLSVQEILKIKEKELKNFVQELVSYHGDFVEYAIKMDYIEKPFFLKNQEITFDKLEKIANHLILFYKNAEIQKKTYIKKAVKENFQKVKDFIGITIEPLTFLLLKKFNKLYLKNYRSLFRSRIQNHWVRDCHGDLHLEHIIYRNGLVCIYDCIEFNQEFRYIDIANDIAFLCMDLEFLGYYKESRYFLNLFYQIYRDFNFIFLQDFYRSYRAFVRGKVYSLKLHSIVDQKEKIESIEVSKKYFQLSLKYALKGIEPTLFVFMGRIGSGKSTYAKKLAELLGVKVFSSDVIRKQFFNLNLYERTPEHLKKIVYSKFMTKLVYQKMIREAIEFSFQNGVSVLDATFATRALRNLLVFSCFEQNSQFLFIEIETKKEIIIERITYRMNSKTEVSDAGVEEFLKFYEYYQPPNEIPKYQKIKIRIQKNYPIEKVFQHILHKILNQRFRFFNDL